jgi:hypothetical protein
MARLEHENMTLTKMNDSLERRAQAMKIRSSKQMKQIQEEMIKVQEELDER